MRSFTTLPVAVVIALLIGLGSIMSTPSVKIIITPEIFQSSMSTQYLDYQFIGMCPLLHCLA